MITELASQEKVIGVKQSRKAIREGRARQVFLACDADPAITGPVASGCAEAGIPVREGYTMAQLGQACHIAVGASVVAVL
ncbi:ribosomal L7Ae/L30e/S12e/Gadd45 family protein [uncultured Oscillibacter sp.]|uniref:L7Ae/L30e/S12e/Gadd45 family ribosomal protein n=1 Tax=uncultured Oscillibacter sp. TaxID=876091 RepID=UPI0025D6755D|nr:ribosomal L7Ae/L30e/S12e/Gadd45 family protein [uncultured Oscillibacter sp.]